MESYIINGDITAKYFKSDEGACQNDPISVYLVFALHESDFSDHSFLQTASVTLIILPSF